MEKFQDLPRCQGPYLKTQDCGKIFQTLRQKKTFKLMETHHNSFQIFQD